MNYLLQAVFTKKKISKNKVIEWMINGEILKVNYQRNCILITLKNNNQYVLSMSRKIKYPINDTYFNLDYACATTRNANVKVFNQISIKEVNKKYGLLE